MKIIVIAGFFLCTILASTAFGQSSKEKAASIAAEFNKEKHKVKEKNGVKVEAHKIVEAAPEIRGNIADYAGKYELGDLNNHFVLRQSNKNWEADFFKTENGKEIKLAVLKNIKIESALLTATIQHLDGRVSSFEGVFINRIENGVKDSGFGIRHLLEFSNGFTTDKAFYRKAQ